MGVRLVIHNFEVDEMDYTGTHNHDDLLHRDWVDQHPIYAITGLQEVLNTIEINLINITNRINTLSDNTGGTVKDHAENFEIIKCTQLPTENIKTMTIYFLQIDPEQDDLYEEYMYIDGQWEKIGNTRIDLSDYVTKADLDKLPIHKHSNKVLLDKLSIDTDGDLNYDGQKVARDVGTGANHTHSNKNILDKFGIDTNNNLTYNGTEIINQFTLVDVVLLMDFLWPDQAEGGFVTKDGQYIITSDEYIFVPYS